MTHKHANQLIDIYWAFFKGARECDRGFYCHAYIRHATDVCIQANKDHPEHWES